MNLIRKSITHRRGPTLFCGQLLRRNSRVVVVSNLQAYKLGSYHFIDSVLPTAISPITYDHDLFKLPGPCREAESLSSMESDASPVPSPDRIRRDMVPATGEE